ncbi:hypothetical protein ACJIZ3_003875 [Penstemon smallii]|uniref:Fe2OG dioxygenase domain-containing protein n=1 Tax=Penstemon smallii TaxID=265156 RepID=A0ABD3S0I5_9LAMI
MLGVHCYPPCLNRSNLKSGLPPHVDHSIITVLLQSAPGLQIIDVDSWKNVPELKGSLQVLVGDHLEVISNGLFISFQFCVLLQQFNTCSYSTNQHRTIPSSCDVRLSIANLHSFGMDEIVLPCAKLEDENNPTIYKGSSLRDFLNFLSRGDTRTFMETIKS